jgi:hypothetical protein
LPKLDSRIPVALIAAALLALFTYRAQRSGEAVNRFSTLRQAQSPRLFAVMIVARWIGVVALILGAGAVALGLMPIPNSN